MASRAEKTKNTMGKLLTAAGVENRFAAILELLADAKWLKKSERHLALKKLLKLLGSRGSTKETRIQMCREFIDRHLAAEPAIYPELQKLLQDWEAMADV
jgi:hypothetical protein